MSTGRSRSSRASVTKMPAAVVRRSSITVTGTPSRRSSPASGPSFSNTALSSTSGRSTRYDATVASWTSAPAQRSADMTWQTRRRGMSEGDEAGGIAAQLVAERARIVGAPDLVAQAPPRAAQELAHRPPAGGRARRQAQAARPRPKARQQVVDVAEQPAVAHADGVRPRQLRPAAQRELEAEPGKVDAGVDRQLKRSPVAAVDLDEEAPPAAAVALVLQHGDAVPLQRAQQAHRVALELRLHRGALAEHAHSSGRRLLAQPRVRERRQ